MSVLLHWLLPRSPVDVVVWRHPGETEAEAIEALHAAASRDCAHAKGERGIPCRQLGKSYLSLIFPLFTHLVGSVELHAGSGLL